MHSLNIRPVCKAIQQMFSWLIFGLFLHGVQNYAQQIKQDKFTMLSSKFERFPFLWGFVV